MKGSCAERKLTETLKFVGQRGRFRYFCRRSGWFSCEKI